MFLLLISMFIAVNNSQLGLVLYPAMLRFCLYCNFSLIENLYVTLQYVPTTNETTFLVLGIGPGQLKGSLNRSFELYSNTLVELRLEINLKIQVLVHP